MSRQAAKLKKQKKRERDNRRQKLADQNRRAEHERRRAYRIRYPEFRFDTANGDPGFVQTVKKALATISFEDTTIFAPWETELYRMLKREGSKAVADAVRFLKMECYEEGDATGQAVEHQFYFGLGQAVLDRIPKALRDSYLPINDVRFVPRANRIQVIFRSLLREKGPGGTIYYSRRKPTLEIDGTPKVVAFSIHAIRQACERLKPRGKTSYAALGDAVALFDQCIYFERCDLYDGQLAFTFYDQCVPGYVQQWYVDDVLGEENVDRRAGKPHYRLGYCPAVIEGDFIKAKTLLFPGYASTPEYGAILQSDLSWPEKRELIDQARDLTSKILYDSQDLSPIKWFHDHGVPQVVHLDRPTFAPVTYH